MLLKIYMRNIYVLPSVEFVFVCDDARGSTALLMLLLTFARISKVKVALAIFILFSQEYMGKTDDDGRLNACVA